MNRRSEFHSERSRNLNLAGPNLNLADSNPGRVKPITLKLILVALALLRYGKNGLAQYQDNVTEWDGRSWYWWLGVPVRQHYKVWMSAHWHKSVPSLV